MRPVSPRNADGARAPPVIPTTVRSDRPAPGCPSGAFCVLFKPVHASKGPLSPGSADGARAQLGILTQDCSERPPGARMPVRRFQCAIEARLRQLRCPSAHATHTASEHCPSFPTTAESDRPAPGCPSDASCALSQPVYASRAAREPTQGTQGAGEVGHTASSTAPPGAGAPTRSSVHTIDGRGKRPRRQAFATPASRARKPSPLIVPSATGTSSARTPAPGRARRQPPAA